MESAPQSTITHKAVISVSSRPVLPPRHRGFARRTHKRRPSLPTRVASNRPGPCQNRLPGATLRTAKLGLLGWYYALSERILPRKAAVLAGFSEMAVGQALEHDLL